MFAEVVCGSVLGGVFVFFGGRVPRKVLRKCFAEALKYYRAVKGVIFETHIYMGVVLFRVWVFLSMLELFSAESII